MRIGQKLSISLLIIAVGNFVDIAYKGYDLHDLFFYVLIFIPFILIFSLSKREPSKKTMSVSLMVLSLFGFWFGGDSSLIGTTMMCFSFFLNKNRKLLISYIIVLSIVLIIRFTFTGQNPAQVSIYLAGSSFIFVLYLHYLHPKGRYEIPVQPMITCDVNKTVVEILQYRANGYDWPEINDILELNVKDDQLSRRVRDERKKLGFKNQDQFILYLVKNGVIRPFSSGSDTRY